MANPDLLDFRISTTAVSGSGAKLENLATPVDYPKSLFTPYSDEQILVSGLTRGVGFPTATWSWDVLPRAQRDMLRTFCPGKSANVFIRTKTMDTNDSYDDFSAIMVWPTQEEERDTERRVKFKITFRFLVTL